ncbi:MAG TPA: hypothetical protein VIC54_09775 [Terriglobales bacterium]|jgi:hypothetical protein
MPLGGVKPVGQGPAITALVLGILGILLLLVNLIPFVGSFIELVVVIPGLIFAFIGLRRATGKGMAIAGLIMCVIGLLIAVLFIVIYAVAFARH